VDDTVNAFARCRETGGISEVGSGDLDARVRSGVEWQRPAVDHQSQLVRRLEKKASEAGAEVSRSAGDEESHSQTIQRCG
jgi:hypothetical protein